MTYFDDYDNARVVLCDGAISVDGVMVSASRSFVRDVRIAHPTDRMQKTAYWRDMLTPQVKPVLEGYKYCTSGLRHAAPFEDAILPLDHFNTDRSRADGKYRMCAECQREMDRRYYAQRHNGAVRIYRRREWE